MRAKNKKLINFVNTIKSFSKRRKFAWNRYKKYEKFIKYIYRICEKYANNSCSKLIVRKISDRGTRFLKPYNAGARK